MAKDTIKVVSPISTGEAQKGGSGLIPNDNFGSVSGTPTGTPQRGSGNNIKDVAFNMPRTADSAKPAPSTVSAMPKDDVNVPKVGG